MIERILIGLVILFASVCEAADVVLKTFHDRLFPK